MRFFEQVQTTVFENGFMVVTDHFSENAKTAAAIVLATGGFHDPVDQLGAAHLMEHLLGHSNRKLTQKEFSFAVRRMAITANLSTSSDTITAHADGRTASVMTFMGMAAPMFVGGGFTPDHVTHERGPIIDEMSNSLSTRQMAHRHQQLESIFGLGARATLPIGGVPEHLERISYRQLRQFWRDHVVGANMAFISAGGLTHKEAVDFCREYAFDTLPRGHRRPRFGGPLNMADADFSRPEQQGKRVDMRIRFNASSLFSRADTRFKLDLVEMYLTNALMNDIRFDEGLLYEARADYSHVDTREGLFSIYAGCQPELYDLTINSLAATVADAAKGAKRLRTVFDMSRDTVRNIVAEHAADLTESMSLRRTRMMDGLLNAGALPDILAEQKVLESVGFDEVTALVAASMGKDEATVEHWGHIGPERMAGGKITGAFRAPVMRAVA